MSRMPFRILELVWVKASLNLKSEASINYLSYAWWIIEPLLQMAIYYLVFSFLLKQGGSDYVPFLLTGLIPWIWFGRSVSHAQGSIIQGKYLMNQVHVPKIFFPLTFILQDAIKQILVFILLFVFLLMYGYEYDFALLWFIPVVLIQLLLIVAFSLSVSLIVPFIRDFSFVVDTGLQIMMFCSGIFFNYRDIPAMESKVFFVNPMAVILSSYRDILMYQTEPNLNLLTYVTVLSLAIIIVCLYAFKKLEYILPRVVQK
ncbi:ABC transporter permease [Vibrio cholerae]|nr:ABC transporter permease [Vibrio cholerae]EJY0884452.1 ABC transporter permease [Vibrio cholerae]BCN19537.1 putative O-antigen ABC transporter permease [Vibrio cholerae]GHW83590.1 teichoic acid ABC transporter permease [Vibrio cholerae]